MAGELLAALQGQGVRKGGILSTDLFKVHGNTLLDRIEGTGRGCYIGDICCAAPTCADDMLVLKDVEEVPAQYSCRQPYNGELSSTTSQKCPAVHSECYYTKSNQSHSA